MTFDSDEEEFRIKQRKKWRHLKELGQQCRILSCLTFFAFAIASIALIAVCASTLDGSGEDPAKYDTRKLQDPNDSSSERYNVNLLITLTVLSILATIVSLLMVFATLGKNMWLTIPYWLMLLALIGEYCYQLLFFGFCIGKCEMDMSEIPNINRPTPFAKNILTGGGGSYIFTSLIMISLLAYAFIPSFAFFLECCSKRAEEQRKKKAAAEKKKASMPPAPPKPPTPPPPAPPPAPPVAAT